MLRFVFALAACLTLVSPAQAADIEENEPLVMRLIFEDCFNYLRGGKPPFDGLLTGPGSKAASKVLLPSLVPELESGQLLSPRYVAAWGDAKNRRHCMVRTPWQQHPDGKRLLGIDPAGFLKRLTRRASAAGLTAHELGEEFSPVTTSLWHEPYEGDDASTAIHLTVLPTYSEEEESLLDAGLIIMSGPIP